MIGRLVVLGGVAAGAAVLADRLLPANPQPIRSLVVIDAPVERVWAAVTDIEGQPRWMRDMKSVRLATPPPYGVGTRAESTIRMFGIASEDPVTVTEWEPPRRYAIRHDGAFAGGGVFTLEPGADGTTTIVRWEERLESPVLPRLADPILRRVFGPIFQADLHHLRRLFEREG